MKDRKTAAALQYRINEDSAPRVVASGQGIIAQRIIELAREHNVPIHEDAELAAILSRLDIGSEIPPELYQVIAEILSFVYSLDMRIASAFE